MDKKTEKRKAIAALNKVIETESDIDDAFDVHSELFPC